MIKRIYLVLLIIISIIETQSVFAQSSLVKTNDNPKNIILLIGDGMSLPQIYAAMNSVVHELNMQKCTGNMAIVNTSSANDEITDSAAGGTAIATGQKTNNGYIGVTPDKKPLKSILKIAEDHNLSTGLVATSDITHATPASFIANVVSRNQASDIALDFLKTDVDVFIGGGLDQFANRADKLNLIDSLKAREYTIAYNIEEIKKCKDGKLAGLLYPGHAPKMLEGRGNMLPEATAAAIDILSDKNNGFFLMIEGSQIDWGGHANDIDYVVSEVLDFDKAVGIALEFAEKDGETLVIITSDHETGGLTLVENELQKDKMKPSFSTTDHTALPVVLFAYGKGATKYTGILENTDIFHLINESFGFANTKSL
jgi:alkaline phosphatase